MWRLGSFVRSQHRRVPGRLLTFRSLEGEQVSVVQGSRLFSRRTFEDPEEVEEADAEKLKVRSFTASDMEFYNQLAVDMDISDWVLEGGVEFTFLRASHPARARPRSLWAGRKPRRRI